ncbi:uncharacterized protein VTP21DRAFT_3264 [Calcarisporiella thermophila]|uniref:uncharacterized protein n=1 Tax=Calcarisporiella thermophila TaxID=911321 RepID=UPI0037434452
MEPLSQILYRLLHPHYILNLLLSSAWFLLRHTPLSQHYLPEAEGFEREYKIYIPITLMLLLKLRSVVSAEEAVSVVFLYAKVINLALFYWYGRWWILLSLALAYILVFAIIPQPPYRGPTNVVELTGEDFAGISTPKKLETVEEENVKWIVLMYATWNAACRNFEPVVARTSLKYTKSVKFGKIDVEKYPGVAESVQINTDPTSFDLPTLVMFQSGKEIKRLPERVVDDEGRRKLGRDTLQRLGWDRTMKSIVSAFKLEERIDNKEKDEKLD